MTYEKIVPAYAGGIIRSWIAAQQALTCSRENKPFQMSSVIALLTDFGTADPYVGIMKGVIATRCNAAFIDITHEVGPQNVLGGAYLLQVTYRYFPKNSVFLCVVDPGVGTSRRPIALHTSHGLYVGPDNGLFSAILAEQTILDVVEIQMPEHSSATFHGRDVFAPAAAELACGSALSNLGPSIDPNRLARLDWRPVNMLEDDKLEGIILHVDHFGNAISSIGPCRWAGTRLEITLPSQIMRVDPAQVVVHVGEHRLQGIHRTYGNTPPKSALALISSDGQIEIAVNQGSAAAQLQIAPGDRVLLTPHA